MCDTLRNTLSRGRSLVPEIRLRWRSWMRTRRSSLVLILMLLGSGLSGLLLQHFTGVADALLLVGIRFAQPADVRGDLADQLAVDARHGQVRLLVDRDVDPVRDVEDDRVRVAEREDHLLALDLSAVADTDDVELFLVAVGHAGDGIGDEAAGEAVELAELRVLGRNPGDQLTVGHLEVDAGRERLAQFPFRTLHFNGVAGNLDRDALRNRDRLLANS